MLLMNANRDAKCRGSSAREHIEEFLRASQTIDFAGMSRSEIYTWIQEALIRQEYFAQGKKERGALRAYLSKVSGRSMPQITRLIRRYRQMGQLRVTAVQRHKFPHKYTQADVQLGSTAYDPHRSAGAFFPGYFAGGVKSTGFQRQMPGRFARCGIPGRRGINGPPPPGERQEGGFSAPTLAISRHQPFRTFSGPHVASSILAHTSRNAAPGW